MDRSSAQSRSWRELGSHRDWLGSETARLLEFARGAEVAGGFGWLDAGGLPEAGRPLQLWITTRMTHVFALGELIGHPGCGPLVDHGLTAIRSGFEDHEHGGWFPEVTPEGPVRTDKEAYPHSFVLLAAASAAMAGHATAPALLDEAIAVIEARFWAEDEGACREAWDRGWEEPEAYRGANANMHMVEAFLAAGDATGDARWYERALRAAERLIDTVARAHDWRILEHFDAHWRPLAEYNADEPRHPFRPYGITPGHGLEWSRLLLQIHAGLGGRPGWLVEAAGACSRARSTTAGASPAVSPTRPTSAGGLSSPTGFTGPSPRRSAPPPYCTRLRATRSTSTGTAPAGTSPRAPDRSRTRKLARRAGRRVAAERADVERQARRLPLAAGHAHPPTAGRAEPRRRAAGRPARLSGGLD